MGRSRPGRTLQPFNAPDGAVNRIVIPSTQFLAGPDGTPELSRFGDVPVWALDQSVDESIVEIIDWPSHWRTVNISVAFANPTANAGNVRLIGSHKYIGSRNGLVQSGGNLATNWTDSSPIATYAANTFAGSQSYKTTWI